jgi:hypothetical protein
VNSYVPIEAKLNDERIIIHPAKGSFLYISDYEHFEIEKDVLIVGIENAENFAKIHQQQYLFKGKKVLFVSRYPQSNDLVKWLQQIPNNYLHFGDLDFAGISIYLSEFKKHLGGKATFFLPENTDELLKQFGNRELFNKQYQVNKTYLNSALEKSIQELYVMIFNYKKVLEQEIFITKTN